MENVDEVQVSKEKVSGWTSWVATGGILMIITGIMQAIYGFAALFNQNWYISTPNSVYLFDVGTWGWMMVLLGTLVFTSGSLLLSGNMFGRTMGVFFAFLGILFNLAFLATTPVWSLLGIVLYSFVVYAIIAHGGEMKTLAKA